ncbi:MAG: beta strand repeat-containing protein [Nostoc sp. ChiSLP01]|nr:calcium-binding protein [Nostoc sp. CmiSLP01]MDZ8283999.1 calcium-binding protein [Nostoc sp. ChiSLP01]
MPNIIGTNDNDTLLGTISADTINGKAGNDTITGDAGNDTLTGGGGKDTFIYDFDSYTDIITDFGGVGKGTNPTASVIAEVDTIQFIGEGLSARNLLLTQNGTNLEITFEGVFGTQVVLENFNLENLENLKASPTRPAIGNIIFDGQSSIIDSFNVLDANSTETSIGIKNAVTFLNDLANKITALDNSNDVVNGQGGNDKIDGLSGDDLLRGGAGNDTLIGRADNDVVLGDTGDDSLEGGQGNDLLNGGEGRDILRGDVGNDKLLGDNGDDVLLAGSGNDTLVGGTGSDRLIIESLDYDSLAGNQLLNGDDGNDTLSAEGYDSSYETVYVTGNNTLNGGAGDDYFIVNFSKANNLLNGGTGNDTFFKNYSGNDTVDGGAGDDFLSYDYDSYYYNGDKGITSTFNAKTNTGSITLGTNQLSYKNIERLAIEATSYDDKIVGSNGDDTIKAGNGGNDTVDGGTGNDLLVAPYYNATGGMTTVFNTTTNTGSIKAGTRLVRYKNIERLNITGTNYNDLIVGNDGNDTLDPGSGGNDTVDGGTGDDLLLAYYSATGGITTTFNATTNTGSITAGTRLVRYKNIERLNITGTNYNDLIVGNNGNDTLSGGNGGNDTIIGGRGNDYLNAKYSSKFSSKNNTLNGGTGDDTLDAQYSSTDNLLSGEEGNDSLFASGYSSGIIEYDRGSPSIYFYQTSGNNTLNGGAGNDSLNVDYSIGDNLLNGGDSNDYLTASGYDYDSFYEVYRQASGDNTLKGGAGSDSLIVDDSIGDNLLDGGDGNDILSASGATGKNTLKGGNGNDSLIGGSGIDTFVFNSFNEGVDKISDFNATNEVIQVSAAGFGGGLSAGVLLASQLKIGTSATTSTQRFIYNSTTGALFFDQDGSAGAFAQVQFALVTTGLSLTNTNFVVV